MTTQITRVESDLGQPLLKRAERGRVMQLTSFGERVADAAREALGGKGPTARGEAPTQLRDG
ncbi:hypothetical protein [Streptomyces atratus]|uniref:hypothetical protein n=1 Tax=Streptomyces atratus TaxID=1893 RepID=UPI00225180EB|nr:hypothetical protein [Streptomyces atratus]MCX5345980.1 hypothetical protein [Streptomyces atratus]